MKFLESLADRVEGSFFSLCLYFAKKFQENEIKTNSGFYTQPFQSIYPDDNLSGG